MALYYEDVEVGTELVTASRTITETDLVTFAMYSGDWNPIHVDDEFARQGQFGRRVVHGMCGFTIMGGLIYATGWFSNTTIALLGFRDWKFVAPIFVGDTISCQMKIIDKRITRSGDRGFLDRRLSLWNQRQECVQEGTSQILIRLKPQAKE
jgi:acyl dehydratase